MLIYTHYVIPKFRIIFYIQEIQVMFPAKKVQKIIGSRILVEMKGDSALLEGILCSVDDYMNLHITEAVEVSENDQRRDLGSVVLRGNNIVLITPLNERINALQ